MTAAALLIAVVFIAFATSGVTFIKLFGIGLTLAVLVDAFVIRATLVPAFMRWPATPTGGRRARCAGSTTASASASTSSSTTTTSSGPDRATSRSSGQDRGRERPPTPGNGPAAARATASAARSSPPPSELLIETADESAVSIRAIADAVGVTAPSIYRHFADKDTLICRGRASVVRRSRRRARGGGRRRRRPVRRDHAQGPGLRATSGSSHPSTTASCSCARTIARRTTTSTGRRWPAPPPSTTCQDTVQRVLALAALRRRAARPVRHDAICHLDAACTASRRCCISMPVVPVGRPRTRSCAGSRGSTSTGSVRRRRPSGSVSSWCSIAST